MICAERTGVMSLTNLAIITRTGGILTVECLDNRPHRFRDIWVVKRYVGAKSRRWQTYVRFVDLGCTHLIAVSDRLFYRL
jgi:hypothetical protein